jgi:hypothetical protein
LIAIGALIWPDNDERCAGHLLMKPRSFVEEESADEVIDKSTNFR